MVGLIDIAPASETVQVRGSAVDVYGVSAAGLAHLFGRFPSLRYLFAGKELSVDDLIGMGGEFVSAAIAVGTGALELPEADRVKTEQSASRLTLSEQAKLLAAVLRVTMPNGPGPLVEELGGALGLSAAEVGQAVAPATKSAKPSKG